MNPPLQPPVMSIARRPYRMEHLSAAPARAVSLGDARKEAVDESGQTIARQRWLNVVVAGAALLLLMPLMIIIAAAIRISSPGPVIFRQTRVGIDRRRGPAPATGTRKIDYGGKLFTMYKFRTMRADPAQAVQIWAAPGDARVTAVGRVLRKFRLDELPQLVNVLKGDMNIVGPRPEQPKIFMELRQRIDGYAERQRVLPGITGWAQINHHYDRTIDDVRRKLTYDLEYLARASALEDLLILFRTVPVMLFGKGGW
jgi:lipopolysaccharide/colanic/teichoic acid biosynthesis glycosyltransferase